MINTLVNERYRIDSELGEGGMGTVYQAYDTLLERDVAIKVLNETALRANGQSRLMREAKIVSRLKHPHIVTIYDAGQLGKSPFIVMEMVSGPTLREHSKTNLESTLTLINQICAALEHAHQAGVIHRDLKPENVLLENGELAKLVDFGLAQTVDMKSVESGMVLGTLSYISPEQISGGKLDERTDLYSLGVMFYELITGDLPFQSDEVLAMLQKHLAEIPTAPIEKISDLPTDINDLILKMLSKDPDNRPDSAWDVYRAIETMIDYEDNYLISLHADSKLPEKKHNLPTMPTSFIGRVRELEEISDLLANPSTRLLTILGAGGMGKTRLSIEVGRKQLAHFEDGVYFIPLAPLTDVDQIPAAIAEGVGLQFTQDSNPLQQIVDFFTDKKLLLLMDNYENQLDGVDIVSDILMAASEVKVLTTTRQKLGLSLERFYRLGGLASPGQHGDDSTQLFEERARLVLPSFGIHEGNFPAVHQVVRYVGGMPLGIELAASWVEMMTIEEIAAEMRESLDFLDSELQDLPERHRNMRVVIDQSWALLTLEERNTFKKFGVFRGRFSRAAVKEITGSDVKLQRSLLNKSVIQRNHDGFYQIHELMCVYAEEKLAEDPEEHQQVQEMHADYFCGLMAKQGQRVMAGEHHLIAPEYDNIREALAWSIAHKKVSNFRISMVGFFFYYMHRGTIDDGIKFIQPLVKDLGSFSKLGEESGLVYAQSLLILAHLYHRGYETRFEDKNEAINKGLRFLQASQEFPREQAFIYAFIPWLSTSRPIEERRQYFEIALKTFQELDDEWGIALAQDHWAWAQNNAGDALSAEPHHVEALRTYQELKDGRGTAACLAGIGYAQWTCHNYERALDLIQEGTKIIESMNLYNEILVYYNSIINLSLVMEEFNSAYDLAKKGYLMVQKQGGKTALMSMLRGMILSSIELKNYKEAKARLGELWDVYNDDQIDNPRISGWIFRLTGHLYLELNDPKLAWLNYQKGLENSKQAVATNQVFPEIFTVIKYEIVSWIARWLKSVENYLFAGEIAYFISTFEHYPRMFYDIVRDYTRMLRELEAHLSSEELTSTKGRAEKRELESTLEELLELLDQ